jgi:hypothetical protein
VRIIQQREGGSQIAVAKVCHSLDHRVGRRVIAWHLECCQAAKQSC